MNTYADILHKVRLALKHVDTVLLVSDLDLGDAESMLESVQENLMDIADMLTGLDDEWAV